jgi:uncharacterized membrane protein YfcA
MDLSIFTSSDFLLAGCMLVGAMLYTSVGHAGASAYIAAMALFGVESAVMRPTALVLNILVSSFSSFRFIKAGLFRWRTLWPVLIGAIPMAYLGGSIKLPGEYYKPLVGVILLIAAARLLWKAELPKGDQIRDIPVPLGVAIGAGIGLLSGLTGTGGGIFLSPILLFFGWSETRTASGVVVTFILCNSVAGLLGNYASVQSLPPQLPLYAIAVMLGAVIGTTFGIGRLAPSGILRALGVVLVIAGLKLIGTY